MPPISSSGNSLGEIFNALLVLTGSETAAESALLAGIETMPCAAYAGEQLRNASVAAALRIWSDSPSRSSHRSYLKTLPAELQSVADLPFPLRACFVLYFLMRLPVDRCAELLAKSTGQIGNELELALQSLACAPLGMAACA